MNASIAGSPFAPSIASDGALSLPAALRREAQATEEPVEIEVAVADAGRVRVAQ